MNAPVIETVLITRPLQDAQKITEILERQHYKVLCEPFIEVHYHDFMLPDLEGFAGVIFTSVNAVRALDKAVKLIPHKDVSVFCVGRRTKEEALKIGFTNIQSTSENVENLITTIQKLPKYRRFLYVRGRDVSQDLKVVLSDVRIDEIIVYSSDKSKEISAHLFDAITAESVTHVLFYSRRTAEAFVAAVKGHVKRNLVKNSLTRTKALCLGDSMIESISVLPWKQIQVAKRPNQKSLLALMDKDTELKIIQERNIMSQNVKQPIKNASEIIDRFGGIRPMAAKIDTPVTTVQGWKKRDVIPAARREQILTAAADNNINLSDLTYVGTGDENSNISHNAKSVDIKVDVKNNDKSLPRIMSDNRRAKEKPIKEGAEAILTALPSQRMPASEGKTHDNTKSDPKNHDRLEKAIEQGNKKAMVTSAWVAVGMILLAAIVAALLLWPSMKQKNAEIDALQSELAVVKEQASMLDKVTPDNMQAKINDLQNQARNIQNTFEQLADRATDMTNGVIVGDSPISRRLMVLEEQMSALSSSSNFGGLVTRIRRLEDSIPGQDQLENSVNELRSIVTAIEQRRGSLTEGLVAAQSDARGALGQTLEGVSGADLKAAAMLIAFSQLRDSLNREVPFENDLALLEKLAGQDNPELQRSLARLAPYADNGVLTASGLSGEFRGLTGDIVAASLKGEDVSFSERAKARFGSLFRVEKDGELVNGTAAQITVAKAQAHLNDGNIQEAISQLQSLEGPAAKQAAPFIQKAEVSLLAEQVQEMLGENILSRIKSQIPSGASLPELDNITDFSNFPGLPNGVNMDQVKQRVQDATGMGDREVIQDEASGIKILEGEQGFRGFSVGE